MRYAPTGWVAQHRARYATGAASVLWIVSNSSSAARRSSAISAAISAQVVELGKVKTDSSSFRLKYEPGHPAADSNGNVKYPNVNSLVEMMDMRDAQRSYEANINVISATRRMIQRTIDILKT